MGQKVYISAHHPDPANALADALTAAGHEVVSTWHRDDNPRPAKDDADGWGAKADDNLHRIAAMAETLVLIAGPDRYPGGKFVEAGYALACGAKVYTLGGIENGMLHYATIGHVADTASLLELLKA